MYVGLLGLQFSIGVTLLLPFIVVDWTFDITKIHSSNILRTREGERQGLCALLEPKQWTSRRLPAMIQQHTGLKTWNCPFILWRKKKRKYLVLQKLTRRPVTTCERSKSCNKSYNKWSTSRLFTLRLIYCFITRTMHGYVNLLILVCNRTHSYIQTWVIVEGISFSLCGTSQSSSVSAWFGRVSDITGVMYRGEVYEMTAWIST